MGGAELRLFKKIVMHCCSIERKTIVFSTIARLTEQKEGKEAADVHTHCILLGYLHHFIFRLPIDIACHPDTRTYEGRDN